MTELAIATEQLGVTRDDHRAMQLDAVAASFMPESTRRQLSAVIAAFE